MALHYIVDGYNVINRAGFLNCRKLQDAREALFNFIEINRPQGKSVNKITIVFDGREGVLNFKHNHNFNVVFTKGESADSFIKSLVDKQENPKNIVVVTDDKDIVFYCRSQGAKILTVNEFIKKAVNKTNSHKDEPEFSELPFLERKKINEELSRIWLKK